MSAPTDEPKLSRRDKIDAELAGCVDDHELIRKLLRQIDQRAPGLLSVTGEIRNHLLDLGQRYNRMRIEMSVSVMVGDGEFEAPSACRGQRTLSELPMFARLDESPETRARFIQTLHEVGDRTLDADGEEVA